MGTEVIFFDAAGTLFEVRGSVGELYSRIALRYGIKTVPADLQASFTRAFRSQPPMAFSGLEGEDLRRAERRWWFEVVRQVFEERMTPKILTAYFDDAFRVFGRGEGWRLFPDTRPGLERLQRSGYRLGIVSNFDSRLYEVLRALNLDSFFESVVISSRAGAAKPNRRIFEIALQTMNVPHTAAVHIGDSLTEDVAGARNAGLKAILLERAGRHNSSTGSRVCRSLEELTIDD